MYSCSTNMTPSQVRAKGPTKQDADREGKRLKKQLQDDLRMQEWIVSAGELKEFVDKFKFEAS